MDNTVPQMIRKGRYMLAEAAGTHVATISVEAECAASLRLPGLSASDRRSLRETRALLRRARAGQHAPTLLRKMKAAHMKSAQRIAAL